LTLIDLSFSNIVSSKMQRNVKLKTWSYVTWIYKDILNKIAQMIYKINILSWNILSVSSPLFLFRECVITTTYDAYMRKSRKQYLFPKGNMRDSRRIRRMFLTVDDKIEIFYEASLPLLDIPLMVVRSRMYCDFADSDAICINISFNLLKPFVCAIFRFINRAFRN